MCHIEKQLRNYENPWLVFSGDLVQASSDAKSYDYFEEKIVAPLEKLGFTHDRRIMVPGNHDVCRSSVKDLIGITKGALKELDNEESFLRELPALLKLCFANKFEHYSAAEAKLAKYGCCSQNVGGTGWDLPGGLGVYCMNSALCSFAGLEDPSTGLKIDDRGLLAIDTGSLYSWEQESNSKFRVLIIHHPLDWLAPWAKKELETAISRRFSLILYGHFHQGCATQFSNGEGSCVFSMAPPLFTRKHDSAIGYSFVISNQEDRSTTIKYRQWTEGRKFVLGTGLANDDSGAKIFYTTDRRNAKGDSNHDSIERRGESLSSILEAEFIEASTCISSKRQIWVERDLSRYCEVSHPKQKAETEILENLISNPHSCVVRAPKEFGLSALGHYIAMEHHRGDPKAFLAMLNSSAIGAHRQGVIKALDDRISELGASAHNCRGIILDNWTNNDVNLKLIRLLRQEYQGLPLIILQGFEDFHDISNASVITQSDGFEIYYLRSLDRNRIRELVRRYLDETHCAVEETLATEKLLSDLDALNMHRTPFNCTLMLKLIERAFDDSPVNRTQVIKNVLFSLFYSFDATAKYTEKPDIVDCEVALGYFCEWLVRSQKQSFSRGEFEQKLSDYCSHQRIALDTDFLFNFLATENILIRRGAHYWFRHIYWLFYFTAQRMHHSPAFASYILNDFRYAAFPEVIEFYTGIDRRRLDAVTQLTKDLNGMDAEFLSRSKIPSGLNPYAHISWVPNDLAVEKMKAEIKEGMAESSLPTEVKDAVADGNYDRSKPYHQKVSSFFINASLPQMIQAMKGAARALRNSDYVEPSARAELLSAVLRCWVRMSQGLAVISPILATNRLAQFDGMGFYLAEGFDKNASTQETWRAVVYAIVDNVVSWYQHDLLSKKLGPLLSDYLNAHRGDLSELLLILAVIKQRPVGWSDMVEEFVIQANKNSFALLRVYLALRHEYRFGFISEYTKKSIRKLAVMTSAKHVTGVKRPNITLIKKASLGFDQEIEQLKTADDSHPEAHEDER